MRTLLALLARLWYRRRVLVKPGRPFYEIVLMERGQVRSSPVPEGHFGRVEAILRATNFAPEAALVLTWVPPPHSGLPPLHLDVPTWARVELNRKLAAALVTWDRSTEPPPGEGVYR